MSDSNKSVYHRKPQQRRADAAIDNILQAAIELGQLGDPKLITARELSKRSGYSIGNIYYYFPTIENVFVQIFERRRLRAMQELIAQIDAFDADQDVTALMTLLVDASMQQLRRPGPRILVRAVRYYFRHAQQPELFDGLVDMLAPAVLAAQQRDRSGTLRELDLELASMLLRAAQSLMRTPFLQQSELAGTAQHRQLAIDACVRLFSRAQP